MEVSSFETVDVLFWRGIQPGGSLQHHHQSKKHRQVMQVHRENDSWMSAWCWDFAWERVETRRYDSGEWKNSFLQVVFRRAICVFRKALKLIATTGLEPCWITLHCYEDWNFHGLMSKLRPIRKRTKPQNLCPTENMWLEKSMHLGNRSHFEGS